MRGANPRGAVAAGLLSWALLACGGSRPAPDEESGPVARATPLATRVPVRPASLSHLTVPQLIEKLHDPSRSVRWQAEQVLELRPAEEAEPSVAALVAELENEDHEVAQTAANVLGRIGPPAASAGPALVGMLGSESARSREAAARALARIGLAADAVPALMVSSRGGVGRPGSGGAEARRAAFAALATIPRPSGEVVRRLAEGMADDDSRIRKAAAEALAPLGPSLVSALDPLVVALEHSDPSARRSAATLIARAGPVAAATLPALYGALRDEDARVREEARRAIHAVRGQ